MLLHAKVELGIRHSTGIQTPGVALFKESPALFGSAGLGPGAQGAVRKAPPSATSSHSRAPSASGDLRKLWHQVTQVGPGQGLEGSEQALVSLRKLPHPHLSNPNEVY